MKTNTYVIAPTGWKIDDPNPFSTDGLYANNWSCFSTRGTFTYRFFTGRSKSGCWHIQFKIRNEEYKDHLADFIRYENKNRRTVIVDTQFGDDFIQIIQKQMDLTPTPGFQRETDPEYILHSTTNETWKCIKESGVMIAAAYLKERWNFTDTDNPTDQYVKNEPPEYKEYIMFGGVGSGNTEMIVASYQKKRFINNENIEYVPGARIYLKNWEIIRNHLDTRDGIHLMKVHRELPIDKYIAAVVTRDDLTLKEEEEYWTPKLFADKSNMEFRRIVKENT